MIFYKKGGLATLFTLCCLASCGGDDSSADVEAALPCVFEKENACGPTKAVATRVVDGDTIELDSGEKIRFLLVNTPESTTKHECFGEEAKEFTKSLLEGQTIYIEYDQKCTEKYGRLLAYICYNGTLVNRTLIERGYAEFYPYDSTPYKYREEFKELEKEAKAAKAGKWGACL